MWLMATGKIQGIFVIKMIDVVGFHGWKGMDMLR